MNPQPMHRVVLNPKINNQLQERLRVVVVDDESLARNALTRMLMQDHTIEVVAACSQGCEAVQVIQQQAPDVVFLDVEMPGMSGIELARQIQGPANLHIIFVTAHEQYAIDAFQVHATDYVVKPLSEEKIQAVLERIKRQTPSSQIHDLDNRLLSLVGMMEKHEEELSKNTVLERLSIRSNGRIYFIETKFIEWIESEGNYVIIHIGTSKHILRMTMYELERKMDSRIFFRIHRSILVNVHAIKELRPFFNGAFEIQLQNGMKILSSRGYRKNVEKLVHER